MHAGCPQRWSPIEVGVESTSSLARCNYMSVTRILNENRCVVRWTNDLNFRVTCGKCLKLSRGHGLVPSADSRLPDLNGGAMPGLEIFFCALCMPNGKESRCRWRRMKLERHYCKSLALFISNLSASVPRLRLKCQPPLELSSDPSNPFDPVQTF